MDISFDRRRLCLLLSSRKKEKVESYFLVAKKYDRLHALDNLRWIEYACLGNAKNAGL